MSHGIHFSDIPYPTACDIRVDSDGGPVPPTIAPTTTSSITSLAAPEESHNCCNCNWIQSLFETVASHIDSFFDKICNGIIGNAIDWIESLFESTPQPRKPSHVQEETDLLEHSTPRHDYHSEVRGLLSEIRGLLGQSRRLLDQTELDLETNVTTAIPAPPPVPPNSPTIAAEIAALRDVIYASTAPLTIPNEFACTIMRDIMSDPVMDGCECHGAAHFYDRDNINQHLDTDLSCPMNNQPLARADLRDAAELQQRIVVWARATAATRAPAPAA